MNSGTILTGWFRDGRQVSLAEATTTRTVGSERDDGEDAGADEDQLAQRPAFDSAAVQIGNQIGHRDVEKVPGRECTARRAAASGIDCDAASIATAPRMPPTAESMFSVKARPREIPGAQQDRDVADFLRNLVRRHRQRGRDPQRDRRQHRRGDHRAVDECVERVADDHQRCRAAGVHLALLRVVAMAPQHQLFEEEEREHACQAACRALAWAADVRAPRGSRASSATPSSVPTA